MEVTVVQLKEKDIEACLGLIKNVVVEGFIEEGIDINSEKEIKHLTEELENQSKRIRDYPHNYYLAKVNNNVVGTVAYLSPCEVVDMALKELKMHTTSIQEVVSLYIDPTHQRQGVGSLLFSKIISVLKMKKIEYFAISTGYKKGRAFWTKKLGKESIVFPTYYSGWPCSVWIKKVGDIL